MFVLDCKVVPIIDKRTAKQPTAIPPKATMSTYRMASTVADNKQMAWIAFDNIYNYRGLKNPFQQNAYQFSFRKDKLAELTLTVTDHTGSGEESVGGPVVSPSGDEWDLILPAHKPDPSQRDVGDSLWNNWG